jgi:hypothetical protein
MVVVRVDGLQYVAAERRVRAVDSLSPTIDVTFRWERILSPSDRPYLTRLLILI